MSRVRFDDDRIAGRKRRRRVSSRNGKCQRKIAGSEHHHGPERPQHRANIGLRRGLALGIGAVDARLDPRSLFRNLREKSQLAARTRRLPLQPGLRQRRFLPGPFDDVRRNRLDFRRNLAQECAALPSGKCGSRVERLRSQIGPPINFFARGREESRLQTFARHWIRRAYIASPAPLPSRNPISDRPESF